MVVVMKIDDWMIGLVFGVFDCIMVDVDLNIFFVFEGLSVCCDVDEIVCFFKKFGDMIVVGIDWLYVCVCNMVDGIKKWIDWIKGNDGCWFGFLMLLGKIVVDVLNMVDDLIGFGNCCVLQNVFDVLKFGVVLVEEIIFVFYIDLDWFKLVNDSFGYDVGDFLLKWVVKCL